LELRQQLTKEQLAEAEERTRQFREKQQANHQSNDETVFLSRFVPLSVFGVSAACAKEPAIRSHEYVPIDQRCVTFAAPFVECFSKPSAQMTFDDYIKIFLDECREHLPCEEAKEMEAHFATCDPRPIFLELDRLQKAGRIPSMRFEKLLTDFYWQFI
jgi:hypothetical protein